MHDFQDKYPKVQSHPDDGEMMGNDTFELRCGMKFYSIKMSSDCSSLLTTPPPRNSRSLTGANIAPSSHDTNTHLDPAFSRLTDLKKKCKLNHCCRHRRRPSRLCIRSAFPLKKLTQVQNPRLLSSICQIKLNSKNKQTRFRCST